MITLKNDLITVDIAERGAEMQSIRKNDGGEYLWQGNPEIWGGRAPLMFPICGGLKDDKYILDGKEYKINKHGYARFCTFEVEGATDTTATFLLRSDEESKACFPFDYELRLIYTLKGAGVELNYKLTNLSDKTMYFSIGSHEGYSTPDGIENYDVIFPQNETLYTTHLDGSLVEDNKMIIIKDCDRIPLYDKYFIVDALVFKDLKSKSATLRNRKTGRAIKVEFPGADYFLLWHPHGAPFICMEPWSGIGDGVYSNYDITKKEGIITLEAGKTFERAHTITILE